MGGRCWGHGSLWGGHLGFAVCFWEHWVLLDKDGVCIPCPTTMSCVLVRCPASWCHVPRPVTLSHVHVSCPMSSFQPHPVCRCHVPCPGVVLHVQLPHPMSCVRVPHPISRYHVPHPVTASRIPGATSHPLKLQTTTWAPPNQCSHSPEGPSCPTPATWPQPRRRTQRTNRCQTPPQHLEGIRAGGFTSQQTFCRANSCGYPAQLLQIIRVPRVFMACG